MSELKEKSTGGNTGYYNIPSHAKVLGDLISFKNMSFDMGTVFKAAYRMGQKEGNDPRYELNKIIWHAKHELQELDRLENKSNSI